MGRPRRLRARGGVKTLWANGPDSGEDLERDAQRETLLALGRYPDVTIWRRTVGTFRTMDGNRIVRVGIPGEGDLGGVLGPNGRAFWIEMKAAKGEQRKSQERFQAMVLRRGGIYIVSRSLEESQEKLEPYRRDPMRGGAAPE